MLDILQTLQSHLLESAKVYMVGSAMLAEALKAHNKPVNFQPKDCDLVIETRWSRELTEVIFSGLFDVKDIKWSEANQYANAGVARRTIITLADGRVIDLLVLKPTVNIREFCSALYSDGSHATAYISCDVNKTCELHYSRVFDLQILKEVESLQVWGGTKEFYTKAKHRFTTLSTTKPSLSSTGTNFKKLLA